MDYNLYRKPVTGISKPRHSPASSRHSQLIRKIPVFRRYDYADTGIGTPSKAYNSARLANIIAPD